MIRCVMMCTLMLMGCDETTPHDPIEVDGRSIDVHWVTASVDTVGTDTVVTWTGHSDPLCDAVDDEISYTLTLTVPDVASVPLGAPIDTSTTDLLTASLSGICFCGPIKGPIEATTAGTVQFDTLSATGAAGSVDLEITGDIELGESGGILHEDSSALLSFDFNAPLEESVDCGE